MIDQALTVAHTVALILLVTYGFSTSLLFAPLRLWCARRAPFFHALLQCPYCIGFWVVVVCAPLLHAPLYFLAIPISMRLLPDFLTGPSPHEQTLAADIAADEQQDESP